jgi:hypothetical protein
VPEDVVDAVRRVALESGYFHWEIEFPQVFGGMSQGFDVVLGNPPWERLTLKEKEFFAGSPEIADAKTAATRKKLIAALELDDPALHTDWVAALRRSEGEGHFVRSSGRYPLCGRGDVNLYSIFAELMRTMLSPTGRLGCIVPSGIATDDTTKYFFQDLVDRRMLLSLFDFENTDQLFAGIATINRFCLLSVTGSQSPSGAATFVFFAESVDELADMHRRFTLSLSDFKLLNPNTRTCPIFRTSRDAELTKSIYRRVPVLVDESEGVGGNPWGVSFQTMFHMANDSHLFRTAAELTGQGYSLVGDHFVSGRNAFIPLYEAKMAHQYNHRDGDYAGYVLTPGKEVRTLAGGSVEQLQDPNYSVTPRYWVAEGEVRAALGGQPSSWLLGYRNITNTTTNRRTLVSVAVPKSAVGHALPLIWASEASARPLLMTVLNSFVVDYVSRQKIGGANMSYFVLKQLPVLAPTEFERPCQWDARTFADWISPRALELTFTAWDIAGFAADLGYEGPPFRWDESRRERLVAELNAAYFHAYGVEEDDVDYIMETFPIVKRRDEGRVGRYRTKELICDVYCKMADAIATGVAYETVLDPPPADARVAHTTTGMDTSVRVPAQ